MQIKLNGWQRIGVVLSVIWLVGFYWYLWDREEKKAHTELQRVEENCLSYLSPEEQKEEIKRLSSNYLRCFNEGFKVYEEKLQNVSKVSLIAIDGGSLVLWWIVVRLLLSVYRWIERGFVADKRR